MKIIHLEIDTCSECPYCTYDADYDCVKDSGYDCNLSGKRIVDENKYKGKNILIPDWCELPTKD